MSCRKILIVEDEPVVAMDIRRILLAFGYGVTGIAGDGVAALQSAQELLPDLVVMDIGLRGPMDGIETSHQLRALYDVPVVYLSGSADKATRERTGTTGTFGFIVKPFHEAELRTAIEHIFSLHAVEKKMFENERWLSTILRSVNDAVIAVDENGAIRFMNQNAESLTGWTQEAAVGRQLIDIVVLRTEEQRKDINTLAEPEIGNVIPEGISVHHMLLRSDGIVKFVETTMQFVCNEHGRKTGAMLIMRDVTEKKVLETQFLRAQRMESLGTLAGGIAHDLNNVLAPILMSIQILKGRTEDEKMLRILNTLETSAMRGGEMVKQILVFARGMGGEQTIIDPRLLVLDVQSILGETIGKKIHIRTNVEDLSWTFTGDLTQLHQVLMNLCINARDAMPNGGLLTISVSNAQVDENFARMIPDVRAGSYVMFTVTDTGVGMKRDVIEKIFDPFFTTKEVGKGTGLGLSTVRAIVKAHDGFINVFSEERKGTTFKVYFPAFMPQDDTQKLNQAGPMVMGRGERILVVDDEVAIREIAKSTLVSFHYNVLTAADGTEALSIFAQHSDTISLVLTDMMMPFMDGATTVRAIRKISPSVKVIMTTGLTEKIDGALLAHEPIQGFLPKPYTAMRLIEVVQQALYGTDPST